MSEAAGELFYRVHWRGGSAHPGSHASRWHGGDGAFRQLLPFWQRPDAARIDLRRSLADPHGQVMVRLIEQRGAIDVIVLADLSRSMQAGGGWLAAIAGLLEGVAAAARRIGDRVGFLGFDAALREDYVLPATRQPRRAARLAESLRALDPDGRAAGGLAAAVGRLPQRRALVLLVSDFLMPLDDLEAALAALARHDVQPVVLHQAPGPEALPRYGLLRLRDAESGATRLLLLRPALRARWLRERAERRAALDRLFRRHARPAFHAEGSLDLERLALHLAEG